jgi:hypothetical protein
METKGPYFKFLSIFILGLAVWAAPDYVFFYGAIHMCIMVSVALKA